MRLRRGKEDPLQPRQQVQLHLGHQHLRAGLSNLRHHRGIRRVRHLSELLLYSMFIPFLDVCMYVFVYRTVRGGFPSLLTSRASLPPLDLFRILSVEESEATSSASGEPDVVVTVRRDARLEHANHEDAMFTRNLALSMHTVHSIAVLG